MRVEFGEGGKRKRRLSLTCFVQEIVNVGVGGQESRKVEKSKGSKAEQPDLLHQVRYRSFRQHRAAEIDDELEDASVRSVFADSQVFGLDARVRSASLVGVVRPRS